ncbi:MAG TPA: ABC transporter permease [Puia sp.]|jgi:putative ABC transport system permease protein|nr:ABC transporter permease [Puia sp.]
MFKSYFTIAIRTILRHRVFSVINILGLAIGMTAFFLIFQYVRFETSYDRWHTNADRIYRVVPDISTPTGTDSYQGRCPAPVASRLKKDFPEIEEAVRMSPQELLVTAGDRRFQEHGVVLTDSGLFHIFDFQLIAGDKNTALTQPMSVVLSESMARKYFGTTDVLGRHLQLTASALTATVTGVIKDIPANSQIRTGIFLSMASNRHIHGDDNPDSPDWTAGFGYFTYILLRPHTAATALEAKLPAWLDRLAGSQLRPLQLRVSFLLEPLTRVYLYSKREAAQHGSIENVRIFSIIGLFILALACINFINLTTARSVDRAKEVGVRKVIGALRSQLSLQFIGESVILCLLAFLLTVILCGVLTPLFDRLAGKTISPGIFSQPTDILLLLGLAILVGLAAGFYPALVLSSFRPVTVLKGRFSTGARGSLLRKVLVVSQFTVSILLLIGTAVVYAQLSFMRSSQLGFKKEQTLIIPTMSDARAEVFKQSLSEIPAVLGSTYSSSVPGEGLFNAYTELQDRKGEMQKANLDLYTVDYDFVPQYGLELVAGRNFSRSFPSDSTQAMIINESAARMLGYAKPGEALGRDFAQWGRRGKIIGVLRDFHNLSMKHRIAPLVMRIEPFGYYSISVKLAGAGLPATLKTIAAEWAQAMPDRPFEYRFLDEIFDEQYRADSRFGRLFVNFAALAIFISCLGLLGLAAYNTLQRTKEIGVRKILGASAATIVKLLSLDFIRLIGIAFLIAAPLAWFLMNRWLEGFAYRTGLSWWIFAGAGAAAVGIAVATISFQSIRAALANPVDSLRTE